MSKPGLILVGAGGHAHACIDVIEQQGRYQIAGLIGMPDEMDALHIGYSVIIRSTGVSVSGDTEAIVPRFFFFFFSN